MPPPCCHTQAVAVVYGEQKTGTGCAQATDLSYCTPYKRWGFNCSVEKGWPSNNTVVGSLGARWSKAALWTFLDLYALLFLSPPGQACLASSVVRGANNSLLHSVIKLAAHTITGYNSCSAAKMVNPHTEVLRAIFTLLANCALSAECRGVLKKV